MKAKLKKIGTIALICIIVFFCLFLVGLGYLFLYPKGELFGVIYVSKKDTQVYLLDKIGFDNVDLSVLNSITVNSYKYDVDVRVDKNVEEIRVFVKNDIFGYALKKNANPYMNFSYRNNNIVMEMKEISGWVSTGDSGINVILPKSLGDGNLELKVSVGKTSNVKIQGVEYGTLSSNQTIFKNIDIKVNRGDINFDWFEAKEMKISAYKSDIVAGAHIVGDMTRLELNVGNSFVNFVNAGGMEEIRKENNPDYSKVNFNINKLALNGANRSAKIYVFKCDELVTDSGYVVENGNLEIASAGYINFKSKNFNIKLQNLANNGLTSVFNASGTGAISIMNVEAKINFKTNRGGINIDKSSSIMTVETNSGNINIKNAKYEINAITNSGAVNISFDETLENYSEQNKVRYVSSLSTKTGKVNVKGVDRIKLNVLENAEVYVEYHKVVKVNELNLARANAKVVVPVNEGLYVHIDGAGANVKVDVGTLTREMAILNGVFEHYVYEEMTGNELQIKTNGTLYLVSSNLA